MGALLCGIGDLTRTHLNVPARWNDPGRLDGADTIIKTGGRNRKYPLAMAVKPVLSAARLFLFRVCDIIFCIQCKKTVLFPFLSVKALK